ncbi:MAG: TonB-dependent receptor [Ferruginibacter sp.]|nr:TonB-dependent receptor [Ferruginibacter sp.]
MKKKIFIAAAVIISSHLYAQDSTKTTLDDVVVTATKSPVKQSQTGKVVSVIDQATLQRNAGKTLTEILNYQVGVYVNGANNTLGTNQDVYLRGSASGNTLILMDGIPVSDPSQINNSFDLNNINPAQIERIEILKGAQSTLWGSDAVAGVINIITKKGGVNKISPTAGIAYGSYNTVRANAGVNGKLNKFTYNLNYSYTHSKGFSAATDTTGTAGFDKDGFNQNNFQANLGYQFTQKFSISAMSNYGKYTNDLDAGAFKDDKDYTSANTSFINSIGLLYKLNGGAIHFTNTLINARRTLNNDTTSAIGNGDYDRAYYQGKSFVSELFGNVALGKKLSLVGGFQRLAQNTNQLDSGYSRDYAFGYKSALGKDSTKTTNYSVYASLMLLNLNGFNAEAGVRYNHHSIYGSNATYSFNPSYNIDENTRVFVNISSAYKIPSLYQLYSEYGNKNLKPEESNNYEIGIQSFSNDKKNSMRIVAFKRDIRHLIIFYTDADFNSKYINRDKQNDFGFEVENNTAIGKIGSWISNLTYVDGQGTDGNVKVKNFYRRPNFTFNSTLTLQPIKALTVAPSFRFVGSRLKGTYDAGPDLMPQYYTLDFYAGYSFTKQVRLFVDYRNITNQKYFDIVGYNSRKANCTVGISANF